MRPATDAVPTESPIELSNAASSAMVATACPAATEAALEMLRAGGNAADAAAAAAWALAVCEPSGSGLGGQAIALVHLPDGTDLVVDGHSHGPESLTRLLVDRGQQRRGPRATTIPSMPATIGSIQARFGRLSLAATLAPAHRLAEEGVVVSRLLRRHIQWCRQALASTPATASTFLPDGKVPRKGTLLRQPRLASTLSRLAMAGVEDFYGGDLARDIVADQEAQGGLLRPSDLSALQAPVFREPLEIEHRGYRVVSVPPPGGGLQLLLGLRLATALGLDRVTSDDSWYAGVAEIVRAIFRERHDWPLPPHLATPSALRWMLSEARAAEIVDRMRQAPPTPLRVAEGPGDTTHLCVVDSDGLAISLTQSIQSLFGAKVMNERLGFFYNNYLCTCPRYRHPSRLRKLALPQSNAAPTMVFARAGSRSPQVIVGSAGSRRITSSILQVLLRVLDRGTDIEAAVDAPRIHTTLGGHPFAEREIVTPGLEALLRDRFRPISKKARRSYAMGAVQAIAATPDGWVGAADPRREGTVGGC